MLAIQTLLLAAPLKLILITVRNLPTTLFHAMMSPCPLCLQLASFTKLYHLLQIHMNSCQKKPATIPSIRTMTSLSQNSHSTLFTITSSSYHWCPHPPPLIHARTERILSLLIFTVFLAAYASAPRHL